MGRSKLSIEVCHLWNWCDHTGKQKIFHAVICSDRFKGTCCKPATWIRVGETTGRSRNDRYKKLQVPIKDIYLFPLSRRFREVLSDAAPMT